MNGKTSLGARGARRLAISLAIVAWFLFVPARSLRFWQAWLFLSLTAALLDFLPDLFPAARPAAGGAPVAK